MAIRLFYLQRKGSSVFSWPHFESLFVEQLQVIWGSRLPPSCQISQIQSTDSHSTDSTGYCTGGNIANLSEKIVLYRF
jgi:hypothetical protein